MTDSIYPDLIKNLPDADIPYKGVRGKILQGENHQVIFFDIDPIGEVPAHTHGEQWGIVIEGEMHLIIGGEKKILTKGDRYHIPKGVVHSAVFKTRFFAVDIFEDKDRYKPRKK
ncbi:hypothetical protein DRQ09_00765 [candidate division KSB1 bacterium]|nr:MAG: hypothetical protein DRQ09_00765 [candidate division KSB1 bacterium]